MASLKTKEDGIPYGTFDGEKGGKPPASPNSPESEPGLCRRICCGSDGLGMIFKQFLAEFVGLIIFVFLGALSARTGNILAIAGVHGLTIALLIMAIGHVSGGHLNPAVTLALMMQGTAPIFISILFWVAQFLGAIVGSILVWAVLKGSQYAVISGGAIAVNIAEAGAATEFQIIILEAILTFVLVYTVLMTAVDRDDNALAPMAIGLAVFVDILAGGSISGASMNPARSFGPLLVYTVVGAWESVFGIHDCPTSVHCPKIDELWRTHYIHWVGPLAGAVLAALLYRLLFTTRKTKQV